MSDKTREYLDLTREQGAEHWEGFNPIAPRTHRWMMDVRYPPMFRAFGWALWRTIDRDLEGKTGPPKKKRTAIAHDDRVRKHEWLGVEYMAEDLGLKLPEAVEALNAAVKAEVIALDEDGRISPRGDAPLPRRIKSKNEPPPPDDLFCTECFPQPLILYFQSLDETRRTQYVRLYRDMPDPFAEHLKGLDAEQRTLHTRSYLEAAEYDEQLDADALAAARAAHVADRRMAEAGYRKETRGRPKVTRELTLRLEIRIDPETFHVQKQTANFVEKWNSDLYKNENVSVQDSASLLPSSTVPTVSKNHRESGNVEKAEEPFSGKKVAAETPPRSEPRSSLQTLPDEGQNAAGDEVCRTIEELTGEELSPDHPLRAEFATAAEKLNVPDSVVCNFLRSQPELRSAEAAYALLNTKLAMWIRQHPREIEMARRNEFDPSTYNAQLRALKQGGNV